MPTTPVLQLPYPGPDDSVDVPRDVQALAEAIEAHGAYVIGEVRFIAVAIAPPGFLPADGAPVSRTTYAKLFTALGELWGAGDGSTTFNVPAVAGRTLVGAGAAAGLTAHPTAQKFGAEALILGQLPAHSHGGGNHTHTASDGRNFMTYANVNTALQGVGPAAGDNQVATTAPSGVIIASEGGGQAHWQPSLAIPAYIYAGG